MSERPSRHAERARPFRADEPVSPLEAMLGFIVSFVLLPTVGGILQRRWGALGITLAELGFVLLPAILVVRLARVSPRSALGTGRPDPRGLWLGAIAGAAGFVVVSAGVEWLQERIAPLPPTLRSELGHLISGPPGAVGLLRDLAVYAVVPAVCEELLFRGLLLSALARLQPATGLLFSSLCFGAFHYSPYKFVPTALLGGWLGALRLRSGSLWPSVAAHAANNAIIVGLVHAGVDVGGGDGDTDGAAWPFALASVVAALVVGGAAYRALGANRGRAGAVRGVGDGHHDVGAG